MPDNLQIEVDWERLDRGTREEMATFAAIGIRSGNNWLTEAEDRFLKTNRFKVHLSAYRMAEWLALNWWRLRWEPRKRGADWEMAHRLSAIGGGYVWPNIAIVSDGQYVELIAEPTRPHPAEPLRYLTDWIVQVTAGSFENSVDEFINMVCGRLDSEGIGKSNLQTVWAEVLAERQHPDAARWRKLEALLGLDPDEAAPELVERLRADAEDLGEHAVEELAAADTNPLSAGQLNEIASRNGQDLRSADVIQLDPERLDQLPRNDLPWRVGKAAATAVREQSGWTMAAIDDAKLAEMAGVGKGLLKTNVRSNLAFILRETNAGERIVLRSTYREGRRFDLARLLGDRLLVTSDENLEPATSAYTARQKAQRAFAAELLCPISELNAHLADDNSDERLADAAAYFGVSEYVVRTQLVNHDLAPRSWLSNAA